MYDILPSPLTWPDKIQRQSVLETFHCGEKERDINLKGKNHPGYSIKRPSISWMHTDHIKIRVRTKERKLSILK
jgi:hypothetical protein